MNPIDHAFQDLRSRQAKAFIPFITAGDPDLETTEKVAHELARRGASLIEIGFPYSDPIADGSVVQASYTRALDRGLRIGDIFDWARRLTAKVPFARGAVPVVGMVSYSLVHHFGPERFLEMASEVGFSGAIIPDLPIEESETLGRAASARDFKLIQLITPMTPPERAIRIARASTGFIYYVSVTGITGERDALPPELIDQLRWLRAQTDLPICVGFGISKPEHARALRDAADGIIVGSALVRRLADAADHSVSQRVLEIGDLAQSLVEALRA
jgi:tryptophan synthase alpha chain